MSDIYPLRKGKGAFVYDLHGERFYDFRENNNILGHSDKRLTTRIKNHISSSWNLTGDTIYHRRFRSLFKKLYPDFEPAIVFSLTDLMYRFSLYAQDQDYTIKIIGKRFSLWQKKNCPLLKPIVSEKKQIMIHDMTEIRLKTEGIINHNLENKHQDPPPVIQILNYYWYPEPAVIFTQADLIVMPQFFSSHFSYLLLLINKKRTKYQHLSKLTDPLETLPSLYLAGSLHNYYQVIKKTDKIPPLNWQGFIQYQRLFTYQLNDESDFSQKVKNLREKKILLNPHPPYYQYLPYCLEDHDIKYLKRIVP